MMAATVVLGDAAVAVQQGPVAATFRATDGVELAYTASRQGTPVLLLSGGPGFSGDYMQSIVPFLAEFRAIVLDQRGTGRSRVPPLDAATINLKTAVADVDALREHLQQPRMIVVGHSWGGMLAMAYAAEHPDRIRALVLIGPGGPNLEFYRYFESNIMTRLTAADRDAWAFWSDPARVRRDPERAAYEQFRALLPAYVFERRSALPMIEALAVDSQNPRMHQLMIGDLERNGYDLTSRLRRFDGPVLIVQGRQDPIGESTAYQIQQALPTAELRFVEQSGHFPWIEQPEQFKSALAAFLGRLK
jgi:proline iminopeptidase